MPSREPRPHTVWARHRKKILLSLLLAVAFGFVLNRGALPLVPNRAAFAETRWWAVALYALVWSCMHVVRGGRWYWLLAAVQRVPLGTVLRVAFIGFAALVVFPFRMGEVVRPLLMHRAGRISGWIATGTVGAERVIDGLFLSIFLFVALKFSKSLDPLPDHIGDLAVPVAVVPGTAYVALSIFALAFVAMLIFYLRAATARRLLEAVLGVVSRKFAERVAERVEQVARGIHFLRGPRYVVPFLLATLLYWTLNALSYWILGLACGLSGMNFLRATVVMGVLGLGIVLPTAPGFFGAFQLSIYAALALYFLPAELVSRGAAYVFLTYTIQIGITLLAGGASALLEPTRLNQELIESEEVA